MPLNDITNQPYLEGPPGVSDPRNDTRITIDKNGKMYTQEYDENGGAVGQRTEIDPKSEEYLDYLDAFEKMKNEERMPDKQQTELEQGIKAGDQKLTDNEARKDHASEWEPTQGEEITNKDGTPSGVGVGGDKLGNPYVDIYEEHENKDGKDTGGEKIGTAYIGTDGKIHMKSAPDKEGDEPKDEKMDQDQLKSLREDLKDSLKDADLTDTQRQQVERMLKKTEKELKEDYGWKPPEEESKGKKDNKADASARAPQPQVA